MNHAKPMTEKQAQRLQSGADDLHSVTVAPVHAMDGSQFHTVIEEQTWSELPPTPEEQMPRRAHHLLEHGTEPTVHPEPAQISIGSA